MANLTNKLFGNHDDTTVDGNDSRTQGDENLNALAGSMKTSFPALTDFAVSKTGAQINNTAERSNNETITGLWTFSATLNISGQVIIGGQALVTDGDATSPAVTFTNDQNTGIYAPGGGGLAVSVDGVRSFTATSGGINVASAVVAGTNVSGAALGAGNLEVGVFADLWGRAEILDENGASYSPKKRYVNIYQEP